MHDRDGKELKAGDRVMVPCVLTEITSKGIEYCNITVATEEPMFPGTHRTSMVLNAKQVVKAD